MICKKYKSCDYPRLKNEIRNYQDNSVEIQLLFSSARTSFQLSPRHLHMYDDIIDSHLQKLAKDIRPTTLLYLRIVWDECLLHWFLCNDVIFYQAEAEYELFTCDLSLVQTKCKISDSEAERLDAFLHLGLNNQFLNWKLHVIALRNVKGVFHPRPYILNLKKCCVVEPLFSVELWLSRLYSSLHNGIYDIDVEKNVYRCSLAADFQFRYFDKTVPCIFHERANRRSLSVLALPTLMASGDIQIKEIDLFDIRSIQPVIEKGKR